MPSDLDKQVQDGIEKLHEDGALVKAGDLLFTIDQRKFRTYLAQAESEVNVARASFDFAQDQLARAEALVGNGNIAQSVVDQRREAQLAARGALEQAREAVTQARIDLEYSEIHAPISGRIDRRRVTPGNLVRQDETVLTSIVAVDPIEFKREQAMVFGATHTASSIEEATALVGEITWGANADKAIITVGVGDGNLIAPVMGLTAKGGRVVHTSVAPMEENDVQLNLFDLTLQQKQLVGSIFGSANPRYDIPRLLRMYQEGKLKLDELITREYDLSDINQGYADMNDGNNVRGFVRY